MGGVGVVVNPFAGENRRVAARTARLAEIVGDAGVVRETVSLDEMAVVGREFRERGIDVLAVCGGDGSFFRTLSAVVRAYGAVPLPPFLPLRAGSMNTIARGIGGRSGRPERILAGVVEDYREGRPFDYTERHLLAVDDDHFGFMVGSGAVVRFLRAYYRRPGRGGWAAAGMLGRVVTSGLAGTSLARRLLQSTAATIDCDGERVPFRRFNVVYAGTVSEIGLGLQPAYLATRKPGYFHLLAGTIQVRDFLRVLPRLRFGLPLGLPEMYDNLAQRVRVEFSKPTHYMIDGDIIGTASRLTVETGPRLRIIRR